MANKLRISSRFIDVAFDSQDAQKLEQFYPVHYNRKKTQATISSRNIPEVLKVFKGVDETNIACVPESIRELFNKELNARRRMSTLMTNGPTNSPVVTEHLTLMPHQQLGREIAEIRDRYCFFFDTRTGKTPLSLSIMYDDLQRNPTHKWLVVCPLILIENAWLPDAKEFIPDVNVVNCHAATKDKRLSILRKHGDTAQIFVTNTESFASYMEHFDTMGFYGCIVDESSSMKSHKSLQSKALVQFAQTVSRFYLLSGTPAPNGEWEYYMQLKAVDPYSVPSSYTQFKERYFINVSYNPQYEDLKLRADMKDDLMSTIKKYAIYVDKEDVLNTPGRTFHEVIIEMPDQLAKQYRKLKRELSLEVGDKSITAASAAAVMNKLNQVSSGFIIDTKAKKENKFYGENQQEVYTLSDYRFETLKDILAMYPDSQVLIWANYHAEFEGISTMLGDLCRCLYGATGISDKNDAIKAFKHGDIQYLVANPASADKGLTLTNCHICVYFSLNCSYELFKQSMERIYGDIRKQPKHCEYYVILAKNSIDEVIYRDILQGKQDASGAVLSHLKAVGYESY